MLIRRDDRQFIGLNLAAAFRILMVAKLGGIAIVVVLALSLGGSDAIDVGDDLRWRGMMCAGPQMSHECLAHVKAWC